MRISKLASGLAAFACIAIACPTASYAREVKVAIQFGLAYLPIMVMKEDGLLEAEAKKLGIDDTQLTVLKISGSTAVNEAILSNNADMGVMGTPSLLLMWEKTGSSLGVKGLASMSSFPMILNTTKSGAKSLRDFGPADRIALPATTAPQALILRMAAEQLLALASSSAWTQAWWRSLIPKPCRRCFRRLRSPRTSPMSRSARWRLRAPP
ncbi:hypothetical protein ACU4GI_46365 (plasmid) [Cupriavidus basilensis]